MSSSTISGLHFSYLSSLVIEFDLPWNDEQAATYGDSFRAWADADFQAAIAAVNDACPYNQLAIVVFFDFVFFFYFFSRSTIAFSSATSCGNI
jgi:hypothetical protein